MGEALQCDLPFVKTYRDRHGRMRYYFRKKGHKTVALPGVPGGQEFLAGYHTALAADARVEPSVKDAPGSFGALCTEFLGSGEFLALAALTRRELRYTIDALRVKHREKPVDRLERRHILRWRDGMNGRPGAANTMVRTVRLLLTFGVDRGYRDDNPAAGIKLFKLGRHRAWTPAERTRFESRWPLGTIERTGYALALYSGQRRFDVAAFRWSDIAGNAIKLTQKKTGTVLTIPLHRELKLALAAVKRAGETIIANEKGRALNPIYFGAVMAAAIEEAGLPDDCVLHGLRKSAMVALIDAGCTTHQASAVSGQKTLRMIEEYSIERDQKKGAVAAILKWNRATAPKKKRKL
jgi:integrase